LLTSLARFSARLPVVERVRTQGLPGILQLLAADRRFGFDV